MNKITSRFLEAIEEAANELRPRPCDHAKARLKWMSFNDGQRRIMAFCRQCDRYIGVVEHTPWNVELADSEENESCTAFRNVGRLKG
jgi:hypothetical protein